MRRPRREPDGEGQALRPTAEGVILQVRAQPRASRTCLRGFSEGALKVALTAPPEKGRANRQCLEVLAEALGLKPRALSVVSGEKARLKEIKIKGISASEARERIAAALEVRG